jgi:hypothetical protein
VALLLRATLVPAAAVALPSAAAVSRILHHQAHAGAGGVT